jgi:outer membrane lipoprotein-sorting protein
MKTKKYLSDERGIGFVIEIIIGAVVLAVIGVAVMQYMKMKSGGSASLIPAGVTLNGNCELKDTDLCKFTNNWKGMKDYSLTSTQTAKDGKKSDSLYEISGDDKFHMTSSTNGKEEYNMISIGDTTYTKDYADGKWLEYTSKKSAKDDVKSDVTFSADEDNKNQPAAKKTEYKKLGKEACGKLTCFKYEVIEPDASGQQFIWFDDRDYLLRRMQNVDTDGTSDSTFSYAKPSISVPSPTKKADAAQMTIPTEMSGME